MATKIYKGIETQTPIIVLTSGQSLSLNELDPRLAIKLSDTQIIDGIGMTTVRTNLLVVDPAHDLQIRGSDDHQVTLNLTGDHRLELYANNSELPLITLVRRRHSRL